MAKQQPQTIGELRRELRRKESELAKLQTRREQLLEKINAIDKQVAEILGGQVELAAPSGAGTSTSTARRPRRRRGGAGDKPLVEYIQDVLDKANEPMRVKQIEKAVLDAGYETSSKDFYGIVASTVRNPELFEKVARGQYRLKRGTGTATGETAAKTKKKRRRRTSRKKSARKAASPKK